MRDLVTTFLELVGLLFVNAGVGVAVNTWSLAGALGAVGVLFVAESAVIVARAPKSMSVGETVA